MDYKERDEELYDYYEDVDLEDLLYSNWSVETIANALAAAGIIDDEDPSYHGDMGHLVFTHGDSNEVYSLQEREFIDSIQEVVMFPEVTKKMRDKDIACRAFSVKVSETGYDAVVACISFEKIINKAFGGFNVFCFSLDEAIHFGCRVFAPSNEPDCALSVAITTEIQFEQMIEDLSFVADKEDFPYCYRQITGIISSDIEDFEDFEQILLRRRALQSKYLEGINILEKTVGVEATREKERYWELQNEDEKEVSFKTILDDVEHSLSFIKSVKINPYELLSEAEEFERIAENVEKYNEELIEDSEEITDNDIVDDFQGAFDDPEEMIKMLKKKKGM